MSINITNNTDPTTVAKAQTPPVEASQYREENLKEYLLACGGTEGLSVVCQPDLKTAYIEQDQAEQAPTIYVPGRDFEQPASEFSQEIANRLMQYGLALHEHGHDRYTAGAYLTEKFDRLSLQIPQAKSYYWGLVNEIEDNRIESALIREEGDWALQRLQFVYKNLIRGRVEKCENPHNIAWTSALKSASSHYGKGREQSKILPALLDETDDRLQWRSETDKHLYYWVLPELKSALQAAADEPNGKEAAQIELEFIKNLDSFIAEISPPSRDEEQETTMDGEGGDRGNDMGGAKDDIETPSDGESEDSQSAEADPSGSTESSSEAEQGPDEQSQSAKSEVEEDAEDGQPESQSGDPEAGGDQAGEEQAGEEQAGNTPTESQTDSEGSPQEADAEGSESTHQNPSESQDSSDSDGENSPSAERTGEGGQEISGGDCDSGGEGQSPTAESSVGDQDTDTQEEPSDLTEEEVRVTEHRRLSAEERKIERDEKELERELARLKQAVGNGEEGLSKFKLLDQTTKGADREVWKQIEGNCRKLKGPLRSALQRSQQTGEQRGTQVGKFDSKLGYRLATSDLNVNTRSTNAEKKKYTVIVVLDRSTSMRRRVTEAEAAAGGFVKALEEIGVTVALVDLYRNTARMGKPFESSTERAKAALTSGKTSGTTPLTDALVLSRERVKQGEHYPFMIVVSDGLPNDKEAYLSELSATSFPVIGINLSDSTQPDEAFRECYDVCRTAQPENLSETLSAVARRCIF